MKNKIGVSILVLLLIVTPSILAGTTQISVKSQEDYTVEIYILDSATGRRIPDGFLKGTCDEDGLLTFTYNTSYKVAKMSIFVKDAADRYLEFDRKPLLFENVLLKGSLFIDLTVSNPKLEVIKEETPAASLQNVSNPTVNKPAANQTAVNSSTTNSTESNFSPGITGLALSDIQDDSKIGLYIIIGIGVIFFIFLLIIFFMAIALKKSEQNKPIKVTKLSDFMASKKNAAKTPEDKELADAEKKLEIVQKELLDVKEKRRKASELKARIESDKKQLKDLGEDI